MENTVSQSQALEQDSSHAAQLAGIHCVAKFQPVKPVTMSCFCMSNNYREKMESEVTQEPLIYTSYEEAGLLMNCVEEEEISPAESSNFTVFVCFVFSLTGTFKHESNSRPEGVRV